MFRFIFRVYNFPLESVPAVGASSDVASVTLHDYSRKLFLSLWFFLNVFPASTPDNNAGSDEGSFLS